MPCRKHLATFWSFMALFIRYWILLYALSVQKLCPNLHHEYSSCVINREVQGNQVSSSFIYITRHIDKNFMIMVNHGHYYPCSSLLLLDILSNITGTILTKNRDLISSMAMLAQLQSPPSFSASRSCLRAK